MLSRPVVQGFTVASAILILLGQMAPLLGSAPWGHTLPQMASSFIRHAGHHALWSPGDALIGIGAAVALWLGMPSVRWIGIRLEWGEARTQVLSRLWPMVVLVLASVAGWAMTQRMAGAPDWSPQRVGVVSIDPAALSGLWSAHWPSDPQAWAALIMPTLMITLVGFVSSGAVAQTFALRHGERVDANRELLGLGAANIGAAVLGGMPVAGGLSRSVVNEAAGARSPLSGVITALLLGVCLWPLLPWMAWLPRAALAAIIIVGIASLIEFQALKAAWRYDKAEGWAFLSTAIGVLLIGFEAGILLGLAWSLGAMVWRHSQPHVVEVGRLPGTEHFRNIERYHSETLPGVLMVRIDESLDFTNILRVEQRLIELMSGRPAVRHVVLMLSAVNHIDHSAAQALMELDAALAGQGRQLYLSEIKGPVIDRLQTGGVAQHFRGRMFLNGNEAWHALRKVIEAELIS
ncbi:MAG: SulP family inorganic anion transporter [Aquabacterium sp.]